MSCFKFNEPCLTKWTVVFLFYGYDAATVLGASDFGFGLNLKNCLVRRTHFQKYYIRIFSLFLTNLRDER